MTTRFNGDRSLVKATSVILVGDVCDRSNSTHVILQQNSSI
ncbi:hypothetical protein [Nostoc sp.]